MSAPATAAAWCSTFFRSTSTAGFLSLTLDPDNRKDQDGSRDFGHDTIDGWTQAPRCRIRGKFNDGAHA